MKGVEKVAPKIRLKNKTHLGILISKRLIEIGITEKELSKQIGKCHNYVYLLMRGSYEPPLKVLNDMSNVLGISVDELTAEFMKDIKE